MANLVYNTENKRIGTSVSGSIANIPSEDIENKRISIILSDDSEPQKPKIVLDPNGFVSVEGQTLTDDYIDPQTLDLTVDEDGYITIPE